MLMRIETYHLYVILVIYITSLIETIWTDDSYGKR